MKKKSPITDPSALIEQAEARTDQANTRTDEANTRTELAENREQGMRTSELRYRRLFEAAQDGILILDAESGMIMDVNPFLISLLGLSHEAFLGRKIWELGFFKDIAANEAKFEELKAREYVRYEDLPLETADGRRIEVEFVSNVYLEDGSKVIQCNIRDVSARKHAEAAFRSSEQLIEGILNAIPVSVFWKDSNLVYLGCNAAFARDAGFAEPKEIIGKDDFQMGWNRDQAELYRAADHNVIEGGIPSFLIEEPQDVPGREHRTLLTSKVPLRNTKGEVSGVLGTYLDITQRKAADASHERLAKAVEHAAETIVITDAQGVIVYANPAFEETTGYTCEEALGLNPRILKSGKHDAEFYRKMWSVIKRGETWRGHLVNRRKDGTLYDEEATISPVRDPGGMVVNYVAVKRDVTQELKVESQVRQMQKMEGIGTLASGIAHDLNNVLAPILLALELLDSYVTDRDGRDLIETMRQSAQHGANLVKQVLSFARGAKLELAALDLVTLWKEMESIIRDTFPKNIILNLQYSPDLYAVEGDSTQLRQVFMNLCVNARDAMPKGGMLDISMKNVALDDIYAGMNPNAKAGTYVVIQVSDKGGGIPRNIQEKIFDPFFTTKEPGKGTGMGLATVMSIVKSHGGFINLYSEEGNGSSFNVYLPSMLSPKESGETEVEQGKPHRGHGETVLLVDDEEKVLSVAKMVLEKAGYRVITATNGAEALALYVQHGGRIDIVLTDMAMPVMDGRATILAIKAMNPEAKIIASSGLISDVDSASIKKLGAMKLIPKPYTAETMLRALTEVLKEAL